MLNRPLVLVTTITAKDNVYLARQQIIDAVIDAGLIPVIVSADMNEKQVDNLYESCVGMVIPGGADINPKCYGESVSQKTIPSEPRRDDLEIRLSRKAISDKKPILAICRGMQVLWVSQGGKLIQHVPDITDEVHGKEEPSYQDLYKDEFVHKITLSSGTKIDSIWGAVTKSGVLRVPSMHHQAVDESSLKKFTISARSESGLVEGIELPQSVHPFCVGVQGHPEAWVISKNEQDKQIPELLFSKFAEVLKRSRQP